MSNYSSKKYLIEGTHEVLELIYDFESKLFWTSLFDSEGHLNKRSSQYLKWNPLPGIEMGIHEFIAEYSAEKDS